jgi:ribosomal-protein-alanine N-acetyltransferase
MKAVPPQHYQGPGSLRLAGAEDLDALCALEQVCQPAPWSRGVFAHELDVACSTTWLLELQGELGPGGIDAVAFLVFWVVYDELHIVNVVTAPRARRRGIARSLLDAVLTLARSGELGEMSLVTLEVRETNTGARKLYADLNFEEIGRRPRYYRDSGEDAVVLALILDER